MPRTKLLAPSWTEKAIAPADWRAQKMRRWQDKLTYQVTGFAHVDGFAAVNSAINWEPELKGAIPSLEEAAFLYDSMRTFSYAALWVMKRQAKVLNPTLKKTLDDEYPAFMASQRHGLFHNSLYELAYGLFDHLGIETGKELLLPYETWAEWWLCCFLELANSHALTGLTEGEQFPERTEFASYLDEAHASLKRFEIPEGLLPHTSNLFSAAISIARPSKDGGKSVQKERIEFREFYWEPMLKALWNYKIWVKSLNRTTDKIKPIWQTRDPKTGHFCTKTRGRQKRFSYQKIIERHNPHPVRVSGV
jgi:hypothetical protein